MLVQRNGMDFREVGYEKIVVNTATIVTIATWILTPPYCIRYENQFLSCMAAFTILGSVTGIALGNGLALLVGRAVLRIFDRLKQK